MCGNDGHMSILLATAKIINSMKDKIPSSKTVRLFFQPADEDPGGALPMIKGGCLENVDEVYGLHTINDYTEGEIRTCEGTILAVDTSVSIKIIGKGGHGAEPDTVRDPIICAA